MTTRRRTIRSALVVAVTVLACRDTTLAPEPIQWDAWPAMTTFIAPGAVSVSGSVSAKASPAGTLRANVRFTNTGTDSVRVEHGDCAFGIRLRPVGGLVFAPVVWDDRPASIVCPLSQCRFYVPALATYDVAVGDVSATALRGVIPAGAYDVYVTWRLSSTGSILEMRSGSLTVAGP
jgi:hypothetical protein